MKFEAPRVTNYHVILGMQSTKTLASKIFKRAFIRDQTLEIDRLSEMRDKSRFLLNSLRCTVIYVWHFFDEKNPALKNVFTRMVFCYQNCSDLLWEKIVLVVEKNFWNSRLKAESFQKNCDHWNNLFKQWEIIFGNRILFELVPQVSHI